MDDGSKDHTWEEILKAGGKDSNILGVHFSRNFGKEAAVFAGMAQATGEVVAVMDCDLQHPPELIVQMYEKYQEGYDQVIAKRNRKGDSRLSIVFCKIVL